VPTIDPLPGWLVRCTYSIMIRLHGKFVPNVIAPTVSMMHVLARSMTAGGMSSYRKPTAN
jgi:hypothetical protein